MSLDFTSQGLVKRKGIWFANQQSEISYPEEGNDLCSQIEEKSFWFRHRNNCLTELIRQYYPTGVFYDIGGGNGFVAAAIQKSGHEVVLIEPGETGCQNAQRKGIENIICSPIEDSGFKLGSIPAIGVFDVVEHLKDDIGMLSMFFNYMQKGGKIFITVPAYRAIWSYEDDFAGHYNRYTTGEMNKKLASVGFTPVFSTYIFSILPLPIFIMRTMAGKIGIRKKESDVASYQKEHESNGGFTDKIWDWELSKIKRGESIAFGSSCVLVASKP